ncbi:hypothetical protein Sjap_002757 [Stephania japonica]|uniref:Uncharacterized protein n=1 Tax=Stephania japonica TaxID=461633 RepID=A0AAP0KMF7_9MAGN
MLKEFVQGSKLEQEELIISGEVPLPPIAPQWEVHMEARNRKWEVGLNIFTMKSTSWSSGYGGT